MQLLNGYSSDIQINVKRGYSGKFILFSLTPILLTYKISI